MTTARFERVAGIYRYRSDALREDETLRFAHCTPDDWAVLDLSGRSGVYCLGGMSSLVVDGAVVVEHRTSHIGHHRLQAMVAGAIEGPPAAPSHTDHIPIAGRPSIRRRWLQGLLTVDVVLDETTGVCVASHSPTQQMDLVDLRFDAEVADRELQLPRARIDGWRGGEAFVAEDIDGSGRFAASWEVTSGPGSIAIDGPTDVTLEVATTWGRRRTDVVWVRSASDSRAWRA